MQIRNTQKTVPHTVVHMLVSLSRPLSISVVHMSARNIISISFDKFLRAQTHLFWVKMLWLHFSLFLFLFFSFSLFLFFFFFFSFSISLFCHLFHCSFGSSTNRSGSDRPLITLKWIQKTPSWVTRNTLNPTTTENENKATKRASESNAVNQMVIFFFFVEWKMVSWNIFIDSKCDISIGFDPPIVRISHIYHGITSQTISNVIKIDHDKNLNFYCHSIERSHSLSSFLPSGIQWYAVESVLNTRHKIVDWTIV